MNRKEFLWGSIVVISLSVSAIYFGRKEGGVMAECVASKEKVMREYVGDLERVHRLAISSCSKHDRDEVVKFPMPSSSENNK